MRRLVRPQSSFSGIFGSDLSTPTGRYYRRGHTGGRTNTNYIALNRSLPTDRGPLICLPPPPRKHSMINRCFYHHRKPKVCRPRHSHACSYSLPHDSNLTCLFECNSPIYLHGEASYAKCNGFWYMHSRRGEHVILWCDIFSASSNVEMRCM